MLIVPSGCCNHNNKTASKGLVSNWPEYDSLNQVISSVRDDNGLVIHALIER